MKVNILASGSSGNCIALTAGKTTILIDAGIAKTKIEKRLIEVGITPNNIAAIFVTHAHGDHIKGLPLANKYKIPVYAGEEEWKLIKGVEDDLKEIAENGYATGVGFRFEVYAFDIHHAPNSYQPFGYTITDIETEEKCSVCLDTGKVDDDILSAMKDSDIYIIEANHEPRMVELCKRPESVKVRILSDVGHLSNEQTANALTSLVQGKGERIYLTHLSNENNLPALAEMTVIKALKDKGLKQDEHYKIEVI